MNSAKTSNDNRGPDLAPYVVAERSPEPSKAVPRLINRCQDAIGDLSETIAILEASLELALGPTPPPKDEPQTTHSEPTCAYERHLHDILTGINKAAKDVATVVERLEV